MKKILFFSGYPHIIGGSQRQILNLFEQLPTSQYALCLLTTHNGRFTEEVRKAGKPVIILPLPKALNVFGKGLLRLSLFKKIKVFYSYINYTFALYNLLKSERVDIIQCMDERSVILAGIATKLLNTKLLWYLQTENSVGKFFWNLCIKFSDFIVYNGKFAEKYIPNNKSNFSQLIYTVSYLKDEKSIHANELNWLKSIKKQYNKTIIGIFSSVIPYKGYHHVIDVVNQLKERNDFIVIGLGDFPKEYESYQNWLLNRTEQLNIDNITFVGWYQFPKQFMLQCDIVVLPSIKSEYLEIGEEILNIKGNEGLPTVITEAMQLKKAVIATNVGSTYEQVKNGENGFLIPPSDVDTLKKVLNILLDDADLRIKMGKNGRRIFENNFSIKQFSQKFESVYKQILS